MNFKQFKEDYAIASAEAAMGLSSAMGRKKELADEFYANFPTSIDEAKKHEDFDCEQFFGIIERWEELSKRDRFMPLVEDILRKKEPGFYTTNFANRFYLGYCFNP